MDLEASTRIPSPISTFKIFVSRVIILGFIVPTVLLNECALLVSDFFLERVIFVLPMCSSTLSMPATHSASEFILSHWPSHDCGQELNWSWPLKTSPLFFPCVPAFCLCQQHMVPRNSPIALRFYMTAAPSLIEAVLFRVTNVWSYIRG